MKHAARLSPILALLLLVGCANQTPVQTALDCHATYNITLSGLIDARKAGLISDAQKAQIEAVRAPVYDAILQLDAAAIADNSTGYASALKQVRALLPSFQKFLLMYAKPPPAAALK